MSHTSKASFRGRRKLFVLAEEEEGDVAECADQNRKRKTYRLERRDEERKAKKRDLSSH